MKPIAKALVVAALHLAIVGTLGAKLLYDRATRPHAWIKTQNYDPNLPIRGRYVALTPIFDAPPSTSGDYERGTLEVRDGRVNVRLNSEYKSELTFRRRTTQYGLAELSLSEPILYFIPDTAKDPTRLKAGEELWVDATIPKAGPPRPIRLGIKRDGRITPLDLN